MTFLAGSSWEFQGRNKEKFPTPGELEKQREEFWIKMEQRGIMECYPGWMENYPRGMENIPAVPRISHPHVPSGKTQGNPLASLRSRRENSRIWDLHSHPSFPGWIPAVLFPPSSWERIPGVIPAAIPFILTAVKVKPS